MRSGVAVGPIGLRVTGRGVLAGVGVLLLVALVGSYSLSHGALAVPLDRVWAALTGHGTRTEHLIVVDRRLARTAAGALVGGLLGLAGALTQSITRNPIASPDILGISAGASAFAVALLTRPSLAAQIGNGSAATLVAPAAVVGGLLTTGLILAIAWRGGFDGLRLILVGLGVNALAAGTTAYLLTRSELEVAAVATHWLTGSLDGVDLADSRVLLPIMLVCSATCVVLNGPLAALRLGREVSATLGHPPIRTEGVSLLVAVVAVSAATAVAGPVAFVAFVAAQAAMRLFGTAGPPPVAAGLVGAVLMLMADALAQALPVPLPVGIVTAVVGAPVLLFLLIRHARRSSV